MRKLIFGLILMLLTATPALADLNIVATLPWIGSLAHILGGDKVAVTILVKPNQDPHFVEAKPSMILAGRKADVIMYNGLDLEIGYLPLILESSRNPGIAPGRPGNFDCSRFVEVLETTVAVDRSMGDVHPLGNPHYYFSPTNVRRVAKAMSDLLVELDGANADYYREQFADFVARYDQQVSQWLAIDLQGQRFVAYHKLFEYLAAEFGFLIEAYIEPKPGIPPSAAHVRQLVADIQRSRPQGILTTSYHGRKEAESLSEKTSVKVVQLPADVGALPGTDDWFAFMDLTLRLLKD